MRDWKSLELGWREIGANPSFIRHLLRRHHMIDCKEVPVITTLDERQRAALRKKMLRFFYKRYGKEEGRRVWKELILPGLNAVENARVYRTLVEMDGAVVEVWRPHEEFVPNEKRRGKPYTTDWDVVWLLKAYATRLTGRPQWRLIADTLNFCEGGTRWGYETVRLRWKDNEKRFAILNEEAFLDSALYEWNPETLPDPYSHVWFKEEACA